jgi:hypothetical protein
VNKCEQKQLDIQIAGLKFCLEIFVFFSYFG